MALFAKEESSSWVALLVDDTTANGEWTAWSLRLNRYDPTVTLAVSKGANDQNVRFEGDPFKVANEVALNQ